MEKTRTDITMVLDRSASMEAMREDAIVSFNNFVDAQKKVKGDALFSLVQFNHIVRRCFTGIPMESAHKIDIESYIPMGYTALLDAIGQTIIETKQRLTKQDDTTVVVVVITDGMENASHAFTPQMVKGLIKECESDLGWNFMFLAADPGSFEQHQQFGFAVQKSLMAGRGKTAYRHAMDLACHKVKQLREDGNESHLVFTPSERRLARELDQKTDD